METMRNTLKGNFAPNEAILQLLGFRFINPDALHEISGSTANLTFLLTAYRSAITLRCLIGLAVAMFGQKLHLL